MRDKHHSQALRCLFSILIVCLAATRVRAFIDNALPKDRIPNTVSDGYSGDIDDILAANKASIFDRSKFPGLPSTAASKRKSNDQDSTTKQQRERFDNGQECDDKIKEQFYKNDTSVWIINDDAVSEGGALYSKDGDKVTMEIDEVIRCLEDDDVLYFNTTTTLMPKHAMKIKKNIMISAYMEGDAYPEPEELMSYDKDKVTFTCVGENSSIFDVESARVIIANIRIQGCNMYGESVIDLNRGTEDSQYEVTLVNVDFEDNEFETSAIKIKEFDLLLYNVKFQKNICKNSGAALVDIATVKRFRATGIEALSNFCTVMLLKDVQDFYMNASTFSDNKLPIDGERWNGAALRLDSTQATVDNTTFSGNEANIGGAVYLSNNSTLQGSGIKSSHNSAGKFGGALYVASSFVYLSHPEWIDNSAKGNGGAIVVSSSIMNLTNSRWSGNNAGQDGGAVYAVSSVMNLTNSRWEENGAVGNGGAFYLHSGNVNMDDPEMYMNSAERSGGSIYVDSGALEVNSLSIDSSIAKEDGGAIFVVSGTVNAIKPDFHNNSAAEDGGAFYLKSGTVTMTNTYCRGNRAMDNGGAFYLHSGNVSLRSMRMRYNSANGDGGAMYAESSQLSLSHSNWDSNSAGGSGGALYFDSGDMDMNEPIMINSRAERDGGALYIASGEVAFTEIDLRDNSAGENGGALYLKSGKIGLKSSSSEKNRAEENGDLLYLKPNEKRSTDSTLSSNSAGGDGGAFYVASGDVSWAQSDLSSNKAKGNGGAFYLESGGAILKDLVLGSNHADGDGGAFFLASGVANMTRSSVTDNSAGGDGGAFYVASGKANLAESNPEEDEAKEKNDVVDATSSDSEWFMCTFTENKAGKRGGGFFINFPSTKSHFLLRDSAFSNNYAKMGGAIYQAQHEENEKICSDSADVCATLSFANVEFLKNKADDYGAIAFLEDPLRAFYSCNEASSPSDLKALEAEVTRSETVGTTFLCPNWVDNRVKTEDLETQEFSSLFHYILVEVKSESKMRIKGNANADDISNVTYLEPATRGSMFPRIILRQLDLFGNELDPMWNEKIKAKIVLDNGRFKGYGSEMTAHVVDDFTAFESVLFDAPPGLLKLAIEYTVGNDAKKNILFAMQIRDCPEDEALDEEDFVCRGCDSVHYYSNGKCLACPEGAECNGRFPIPAVGKWQKTPCQTRSRDCLTEDACKYTGRSENLKAFVDKMHSCDVEKNDVDTYDDIQCDKGYESPLCGSCKDEYGTWTRWMCLECRHEAIEVLLFLATLTWMGLLAYIQIWRHSPTRLYRRTADDTPQGSSTASGQHSAYVNIRDRKAETTSPLLDSLFTGPMVPSMIDGEEGKENKMQSLAELIKILMNYLQLSTVLISLHVKWPETVRTFFELAATLGGVTLLVTNFAMDCVLTRFGFSARPLVRLIAGIVAPLIMCGSLIIVRAVLNKFTHRYFRSLASFVLLTLSIVFYISYLGITKLAVSAFYCVSVFESLDASSDKTLFLADDTSVECYTGVHWTMVVIAALVLLGVSIGFPLSSFIYIRRHVTADAGARQNSFAFEVFGFMFWSYESRYYYWELIIFLRKAFLATLSVFSYSLSGNAQQVIVGLGLTLFLGVHTFCAPFRKGSIDLNAFETTSLLLTTLNVYLSMLIGDEHPMDSVRVLCTVGAICLHACYSLTVLVRCFNLWRHAYDHTT